MCTRETSRRCVGGLIVGWADGLTTTALPARDTDLVVDDAKLETPLVVDDGRVLLAAVRRVRHHGLAGDGLLAAGDRGHLAHGARRPRLDAAVAHGPGAPLPLRVALHVHRAHCVHRAQLVVGRATGGVVLLVVASAAAFADDVAVAAAVPVTTAVRHGGHEGVVDVVVVRPLPRALHEEPRALHELVHGRHGGDGRMDGTELAHDTTVTHGLGLGPLSTVV